MIQTNMLWKIHFWRHPPLLSHGYFMAPKSSKTIDLLMMRNETIDLTTRMKMYNFVLEKQPTGGNTEKYPIPETTSP